MKKLIIHYITILILLATSIIFGFLFFSVRSDRDKLAEKSNTLTDLQFRPIVVSQSDKIELGEEYVAGIYLTCINSKNPPTVIINDSMDNMGNLVKIPKDTLAYNSDYQTYIYKSEPNDKGTYRWAGIILYEYEGKIDSVLFRMQYEVE